MLMLILRLLHVTFGAFWVGAILFVVLFLEPSVRAAGPDGAAVMRGIMQRRYLDIMPVVALITLLSAGFEATWFSSPFGMTLSIGMTTAVLAFIIGVFVMRAAALRMGPKTAALQQLSEGTERTAAAADLEGLRSRVRVAGRWVAALLLISVITMAVARYV